MRARRYAAARTDPDSHADSWRCELVPHAVCRRDKRHAYGELPGGEATEERVLDVEMVANLMRSLSGSKCRLHGAHDLWTEEDGGETHHARDHAAFGQFLASGTAMTWDSRKWSALSRKP
jgi:hypothetical protein